MALTCPNVSPSTIHRRALHYLNTVKHTLQNDLNPYYDLMTLLRDYKSKKFELEVLVIAAFVLLENHPHLFTGFCQFIPAQHPLPHLTMDRMEYYKSIVSTLSTPVSIVSSVSPVSSVSTASAVSAVSVLSTVAAVPTDEPLPPQDSNLCQIVMASSSGSVSSERKRKRNNPSQGEILPSLHEPAYLFRGLTSNTARPEAQEFLFEKTLQVLTRVKERLARQPGSYQQLLEMIRSARNLQVDVTPQQLAQFFGDQDQLLLKDLIEVMAPLEPSSQPRGSTPVHSNTTASLEPSLRGVSLSQAAEYVTSSDMNLFDDIRLYLNDKRVYSKLLHCLSLYNHEVVGKRQLLELVEPFLATCPNLMSRFYLFLQPMENEVEYVFQHRDWKRVGTSYFQTTDKMNVTCSGRSELDRSVLNDSWYSRSYCSSENFKVKRNFNEKQLFDIEDERFELDHLVESTKDTRNFLKLQESKLQEPGYTFGATTLSHMHVKAIGRLYGDSTDQMLKALELRPAAVIPILIVRLDSKLTEWQAAGNQMKSKWRDLQATSYHKSLDHVGADFKAEEKKAMTAKALLMKVNDGQRVVLSCDVTTVLADTTDILLYRINYLSVSVDEQAVMVDFVKTFIPLLLTGEPTRPMLGGKEWYLVMYYYHLICTTLKTIEDRTALLVQEKTRNLPKSDLQIMALVYRRQPDIDTCELYREFVRMVKAVVAGSLGSAQFEDRTRMMFGINAYRCFNVDRAITLCVRQLHAVACDKLGKTCVSLRRRMGFRTHADYHQYYRDVVNLLGNSTAFLISYRCSSLTMCSVRGGGEGAVVNCCKLLNGSDCTRSYSAMLRKTRPSRVVVPVTPFLNRTCCKMRSQSVQETASQQGCQLMVLLKNTSLIFVCSDTVIYRIGRPLFPAVALRMV